MKKRVVLLIIATISCLFLIIVKIFKANIPNVQEGVLDLRGFNLEEKDVISLNGELEFYWEKFLMFDDFIANSNLKPEFVSIPSAWNRLNINGEQLPSFGYATYRLKVITDDKRKPLSIRLNSISTAYKCYVNDKLIAQNGRISKSPESAVPYLKPNIGTFIPPDNEFYIIIHVSNYSYAKGGIWSDINIGTYTQVLRFDAIKKYKDTFIIGCVSIMAVCFLCIFIIQRDKTNIYLMLMCILPAVRNAVNGDYLITTLFPDVPFNLIIWIMYLTILWYPVIFHRMIDVLIKGNADDFTNKILLLLGLIFSVILAVTPVHIYTNWVTLIAIICLLIPTYSLIKLYKAYSGGMNSLKIIFIGSTIHLVSRAYGLLNNANIKYTFTSEASSIGFLTFLIAMLLFMIAQFKNISQEQQNLSLKLSLEYVKEKELTEKLYKLYKLKDDILTNASQELRQPINVLIRIIESMISETNGDVGKMQKDNIEIILKVAKKLLNLTNDLFDVSLIEYGEIKFMPTAINLHVLISNMMIVFNHINNKDKVTISMDIPEDFPDVIADEGRLSQVFKNLVGNALKFTQKGTVEISAEHDTQFMYISIKDTGIGIAPKDLKKIFNAFEDENNKGLGLFISKKMIEIQGGKLWITSEEGKGTVVNFTLPIANRTSLNKNIVFYEPKNMNDGSEIRDNNGDYNILVVENDFAEMRAIINVLEDANYSVKGVRTSREALNSVEKGNKFELVILNMMLPELSGFEVLKKLRQMFTAVELPVLIITTEKKYEDISLGIKMGASDYLIKPFETDELLARVDVRVRLRKAVNSLVTTEMSFLQAQIKPHFIHNALSVISSLSIKDPKKAKELICDLSDYLRWSFDFTNNNGLTTLSKELELVRAYISIEQARFNERLKVEYNLIGAEPCEIPVLCLQPLVENAIRHGIMCKIEGGTVSITIRTDDIGTSFEVKDNGVGIDAKQLENIFADKHTRRGVGLVNINRRLIKLYGEGLDIESAVGEGTKIKFHIPNILK